MCDNVETVGKIHQELGSTRIEWDIRNYAELSVGKNEIFYLKSPSFKTIAATWNFVLFPKDLYRDESCTSGFSFTNHGIGANRYVSLYLVKKYSKVKEHHVFFKMELQISENVVLMFSEEFCFKVKARRGRQKNSNLLNIQPEDTVTVLLYIYPTAHSIQDVISNTDSEKPFEGIRMLITNMEDLYRKQEDCDLTIRVNTREFKVHRVILSARSPVLFSMLNNDMAEKKSGIVEIVDSEPDVFDNFLLYLYSGRVEGLSWQNVTHLFILGEKYDLQCLKNDCREYMLDEINDDEFCEVYILAFKYDDERLLERVEEYFTENAKAILQSSKWQEFHEQNTTLCNTLFIKYVSKK